MTLTARSDMRATIRVVAPTLAPLAQLAEELIARLTFVKPTPQFRADLQRALEDELRRRLAEEESSPAPRSAGAMLAAALLTTLHNGINVTGRLCRRISSLLYSLTHT